MEIKLNLPQSAYSVHIGELPNLAFETKVAIITNNKIAGLWLGDVLQKLRAKSVVIVTLKDGEEYKNMASIEEILNSLFNEKFDRKSLLIALGGGVISDMTGFAAAIYQRGINFINIPTTLLAQVDASVGGKTGVNNAFGKNLIGAFWQPKAVYCDTKFLSTLPKREISAGIAEAIKMAVMFDKGFFEFFENHDLKAQSELEFVIKKCVEIKADVVSKDEKEAGIRAVLNYGHTFAHVIENETKYSHFLHGEAVGIGMNMANSLALKLGLIDKNEQESVKNVLIKFEIPTSYKIPNLERFYEAFFLDKKSAANKIKFILPNKIGNFIMRDDIEKRVIMDVLREFSESEK